jgi:glutamine---fructose-6-phosphate transaminase (isomerizing)
MSAPDAATAMPDSAATVMRGEIGEIPVAIEALLADGRERAQDAAAAVRRAGPRWLSIVARGTSDNAAVYARYLVETYLGIPSGLAAPSVTTIYGRSLAWGGGMVLAISQSGQSPDVVGVITDARRAGALTVAVTNEPASPLGDAAEVVLPCGAGVERAVPATKTYVAELAVVAQLVAALEPASDLAAALPRLPAALRAAIEAGAGWLATDDGTPSAVVAELAASDRCLVVSRGYNYATALELALKLQETTGLFADAYSAADLQHGPLAMAGPGVPVLAIRADGPGGIATDEAIAAVTARGSQPWVIVSGSGSGPRRLAVRQALPEALTPLLYIVPGYLLVDGVARARGVSPDLPQGLTKVTRTR